MNIKRKIAAALAIGLLMCGCSLSRIPSNADPAERAVVSSLLPRVENLSWNKAGRLETIAINGDFVTDQDVAQLSTLKDLWEVSVGYSPVTDAGIAHLRALPKLIALSVAGTHMTDRGVESLSEIQTLNTIDLSYTQITDASVNSIARLKNLERLFIVGTQLTDDGISTLKQQLPNCLIQYKDVRKEQSAAAAEK